MKDYPNSLYDAIVLYNGNVEVSEMEGIGRESAALCID